LPNTVLGSITATGNPLTVWVNDQAATLTVGAPITGAIALNKSGAGTLILSAPNLYTGATVLNEGTLQLGANNTLYLGVAAPGALNINNPNALLDLNGYNNAVGAVNLASGSISNSGAGGNLVATGGVNLGVSAAGGGGAHGAGASISTSAGTLYLGGNLAFAATNDPNGATIAGNLALGYDLIYPAVRYVSGGTRSFTVGDSIAAGATGNANPDLTVSALVSGPGLGITKAGAGVMLLSGANT
jgi:autotransporter-associated beta strand protein